MTLRRFVPAVAAATVFVMLMALYLAADRALYVRTITAWGVHPFSFPFLDTDMVLSGVRCRRLGVDVFATNPCDALGRLFDYSPLWLTMAVLPVTTDWIAPVGLAFGLGFLLGLLLLPVGRGWRETALITAGAVSTAVVFAVERGNNELVIFALAAGAASLASRSQGFRLLGYGLALLAGLLKYFPMALMALATREQSRMFLTVAIAATGVLATFVLLEGTDLLRALAVIPTGRYFGDMFGAKTLPSGVAQILHLPHVIATCFELVLIIGTLVLGWLIGTTTTVRADLAGLTEVERTFLLAGALVVLSCFFTAQNIGYRAIELLLVLPSLTALWRVGRLPTVYAVSTAVVLLLLWAEGWRSWIDRVFGAAALLGRFNMRECAWLLREACWWWTVTLLAALLIGLVLRSEMGGVLVAWLTRRTAPR